MKAWIGGLVMLAATARGACAAGYDDFADGLSAVGRGDNDRAISFFSAAIAAGDLSPGLLPVAYFQRGLAQLNKFDCSAAIPDLSQAIKLKAGYFEALLDRAQANFCNGDSAAAVADFSLADTINHNDTVLWGRGRAYWGEGNYPAALADFAAISAIMPHVKFPYVLLWAAMVKDRMSGFDPKNLAESTNGWPDPVFDLYRGRATPEDVLKDAADDNAKTAANQRCEANFYIAEWWIAQDKPDPAIPLLNAARSGCAKDYVEYDAAGVELARLQKGAK